MTTLQRVITMSARCVAAVDAEDYHAVSRLMRERDWLYLELDTSDALTFRAWANDRLTDDEIAALLAGDHTN